MTSTPGRVLQISKYYAPVMGGIETVAWELAEGLNRAGVATGVLCAHQHPRTVRETAPAGYGIVRACQWGTLLSTSIAPAMASHLLRTRHDHEVIHLHMPNPMAAAALWLARPRARLVVHWHSDVVRQRRAMALYRPLERWVLQRADAIIATSPPYAHHSPALQPWQHKVVVTPIGITDRAAQVDPALRDRIRQAHAGRRIVFALGRMVYYKGFEVLIEAAAALPNDCVVLIGGEGDLRAAKQALIEARGLQDKVHLLGHIAPAELPSHYAACDVFCMPSTVRAEAYGVSMVEAMVMGKPIVATDIPASGVPWVNHHGVTGFNVPPRNPLALARRLRQLLRDTALRERLGAGARQRYQQQFTAELMTQRIQALYHRLDSARFAAPEPFDDLDFRAVS